ncbi:MAG TPA: TIGR03618 family F420-dependent PPOX class oxidoreductase [Blastocatellia bacterium]|nr:TIGR03618 family F420-dependent PPOX class oxidoreductase [Blastocatellia bacterium]
MNKRKQIEMTDVEVAAFLNERHTMSVATNGRDGFPHLMAMWYGFLDGKPAFWTYGRSQKVRNLERDDRVTVMIEDGESYATLRGVMLAGRATIYHDTETVMKVGASVYERYNGPLTAETRPLVAHMGRKRVAVCIEVERVVSWDHRKLDGY